MVFWVQLRSWTHIWIWLELFICVGLPLETHDVFFLGCWLAHDGINMWWSLILTTNRESILKTQIIGLFSLIFNYFCCILVGDDLRHWELHLSTASCSAIYRLNLALGNPGGRFANTRLADTNRLWCEGKCCLKDSMIHNSSLVMCSTLILAQTIVM